MPKSSRWWSHTKASVPAVNYLLLRGWTVRCRSGDAFAIIPSSGKRIAGADEGDINSAPRPAAIRRGSYPARALFFCRQRRAAFILNCWRARRFPEGLFIASPATLALLREALESIPVTDPDPAGQR